MFPKEMPHGKNQRTRNTSELIFGKPMRLRHGGVAARFASRHEEDRKKSPEPSRAAGETAAVARDAVAAITSHAARKYAGRIYFCGARPHSRKSCPADNRRVPKRGYAPDSPLYQLVAGQFRRNVEIKENKRRRA